MKKKIVLSTGNANKLREVREVIGDRFDVLSLADVDMQEFDVVEDRDTLEGNALKKARELYELIKMPVIADDSGLFVDALDGEPGVYSARYSGENATYESNNQLLLEKLAGVPKEKRTAEFRTALAYVDENGYDSVVVGKVKGYILTECRGENGFGYDPLFYVEDYDKTFAELEADIKNKISHRANALKLFNEMM